MENNSYISTAWNSVAAYPSITFLSICLLLTYMYFRIAYTYWKSRGVPQCNPAFPFGDFRSVFLRHENMPDRLNKMYQRARTKGHKYIGVYLFSRRAIFAIDPVLVRDILTRFNDRGLHHDEKNDPMNAHIFALTGQKWKRLRTKLAPAYSPKQLKNMFGVMLDSGLKLKDLVGEHADTGQPLQISETIASYTTDVIGSCAYGLECNTMRNPKAEFRVMGRRAFDQSVVDLIRLLITRSTPHLAKLLRIGIFSRQVTEFFRKAVKETIEYREKNDVRRDDFLQILIKLMKNDDADRPEGSALKFDEVAAQAFIFFLAGFETTSTTTSFAIFELATNDEIQEKARAEVKNVLEKHGGVWSYEAMQELTYVDMILRETLRKYPAAPFLFRKCTESYQLPDSDAVIEAGGNIVICCFSLHRDPEYYPDPDLFDPDRFLEENRSKIWDYTYLPFGYGARSCIGMRFAMLQMKITLALLLQDYTFRVNNKTKLPITMEPKGIVLAPVGGLWIEFERNK